MASPEVENATRQIDLDTSDDVFARQLTEDKPRKGRRFWKAFGLTALALVMGSAAYLKFTPHGIITAEAIQGGLSMKTDPDYLFNQVGSQVNILLIGRDVNWKIGKVYDPKTKKYRPFQVHDENAQARSDTMIVVTLNKETKTIRMVSLPRDAMVHLPENKEGVRRAKLNAAHAYGGPELLIKTLHDELGLTIHRYAVIKFDGFKKLIDEVGGIEVKVDGALKKGPDGKLYRGNLDYDDNWGNLHIHLKPGLQRLNGTEAHNYVRFRMDREGDPGRIRRQQQVMRALAKQMAHVSLWRLPGVIEEVQKQFTTDMATKELASAAAFAQSIGDASKIQPLTLFGVYSTRGSVLLNRSKNKKLLSYLFGSTFNAERFLENSPSTGEDEFGPANDATPEAKAILEEAGVLKSDDDLKENYSNEAPVRIEETSSVSPDSRSNRYAAARDENAADEKPRRTRKRTKSSSETSRTGTSRDDSSSPAAETSENSGEDVIIGDTPARHESNESYSGASQETESQSASEVSQSSGDTTASDATQ